MSQSTVGTGGVGRRGSNDTEWEARESQRQRELEEARARAAQMEKTMKWWSECTANWREKWSKVRNERNKAREEAKQLRANLEVTMKEASGHKQEKNELEMQIIQLKKDAKLLHSMMLKYPELIQKVEEDTGENNAGGNICHGNYLPNVQNINKEDGLVTKSMQSDNIKDIHHHEKNLNILETKDEVNAKEKCLIQQLSKTDYDEDYLLQKISILQLRLDEAQKSAKAEKDENFILHKNIETLTVEMQEIHERQEELKAAKQEAVRELLTLQEQHRAEMRIVNNSLQEESDFRESLERRLGELRGELERLQSENASEWGKRERLETEKLALERDNKKLWAELRDYQEHADRKGRSVQATDVEIHVLQQELSERNKELSELKSSNSKLKKLLAETNVEMGHILRRAEQYEAEVKRLRQRVEELKRELAYAEDELDSVVNQVRRLQHTKEELSQQTDGVKLKSRRAPSPQFNVADNAIGQYNGNGGGVGVGVGVGVGGMQLRNKFTLELPNDCLPNINDLRQIFDDAPAQNNVIFRCSNSAETSSKRSSFNERTFLQQQQQQQKSDSSFNMKSVHVEENTFGLKARNFDFERAKKKFDNVTHLQHYQHHLHQRDQIPSNNFRTNSSSMTNNRPNFHLPLKSTTTSTVNSTYYHSKHSNSSQINSNTNKNDTTNRQIMVNHIRSSMLPTTTCNSNNDALDTLVINTDIQHAANNKSLSSNNFTQNNINLDDLKLSDDNEETS